MCHGRAPIIISDCSIIERGSDFGASFAYLRPGEPLTHLLRLTLDPTCSFRQIATRPSVELSHTDPSPSLSFSIPFTCRLFLHSFAIIIDRLDCFARAISSPHLTSSSLSLSSQSPPSCLSFVGSPSVLSDLLPKNNHTQS
jgi:hypothetical protein